jgi:hypothetical protein
MDDLLVDKAVTFEELSRSVKLHRDDRRNDMLFRQIQ